jgi:hypothetical protein
MQPNSIAEYEEGHITHADSMTLRFLCTDGPPILLQEGENGFKVRLQSFALYKFAGDCESMHIVWKFLTDEA